MYHIVVLGPPECRRLSLDIVDVPRRRHQEAEEPNHRVGCVVAVAVMQHRRRQKRRGVRRNGCTDGRPPWQQPHGARLGARDKDGVRQQPALGQVRGNLDWHHVEVCLLWPGVWRHPQRTRAHDLEHVVAVKLLLEHRLPHRRKHAVCQLGSIALERHGAAQLGIGVFANAVEDISLAVFGAVDVGEGHVQKLVNAGVQADVERDAQERLVGGRR
jgi:hypothetical protein